MPSNVESRLVRFLIHFFGWRALYFYAVIGLISYICYLFSIVVIADPFDRNWIQKLMFVFSILLPLLSIIVVVSKFISDEREFAPKKSRD